MHKQRSAESILTLLRMCALLVAPYLVGCDDVLVGAECKREKCEQAQEFGRDADDE